MLLSMWIALPADIDEQALVVGEATGLGVSDRLMMVMTEKRLGGDNG